MTAISSLPVRGRNDHLALLDGVLDEAQAGRGSVTVIQGAPGMGKTRLLQAAWMQGSARSFRMGRGMADPAGRVVELAPLLEALFDHDPPLLDRTAMNSVQAAPEHRFWVLQEIQALLEQVASEGPVLIVIDDLHWADSGTAAALRFLPPRLTGFPIAWMLTLRSGQGSAAIQSTVASLVEAGAALLELKPLDCDAVASVVADVLAAEPDALVLKQVETINGNPFLLVDLVRGLESEGIVSVVAGRATLIEDRLPTRISDGMRMRLARLSETAERVATTAASMGRRFTVADLAAMSEVSVPDLVAPIRVLIDGDIFANSDDRLSFVHDLVRDAVRATGPVAVRQALDRRGADILMRRGALPVEVATQLAACAEVGDDLAIATLAEAAEELGTTDPAAAAELAERALALMSDQHPLRGSLVARRAISLYAAGRGADAKRYADTVLGEAMRPAQQAQVRLSIASMFVLSPDVRVENARRALALPQLPEDLRALLLATELHSLMVGGRTEEAMEKLAGAEAAVSASGNREATFALGIAAAGLDYQRLHFDEALTRLDASFQEGTGEDARLRLAHYFRGWLLSALDRFEEAITAAERGIESARRDRQIWALNGFETGKGLVHLQAGRLPDAAAALEGRVSVDDAVTVGGLIEATNLAALARVRIHSADEWGGRDIVRMCERMLASTAPGVRGHATWGLAAHAMAHGHADHAHDLLRSLEDDGPPSPFRLFPHDIAIDPEIVRIGLAVGDHVLVAQTLAAAEQRQRLNPDVNSIAACVHHLRGLAERSTADLTAAVPLMRASKRTLALASLLEDLGRFLVEDGSTSHGVEALDEALRIAAAIGANRDAGRVRARLRELGIRRRILPTAEPVDGWDALTPMEYQVVQLVVDGCTNRQISEHLTISPHTVNSHLRHIFEKTNVRSRVELTRRAERRRPGAT
jgi:DNA-binding CsgD family transcriptional regulator/tetratricopeptide (TPR) repeat protein